MKIYKSENIYDERSYLAGKARGKREVVEWIRGKLNVINCIEDNADRDKAIMSLIYELKEWGK